MKAKNHRQPAADRLARPAPPQVTPPPRMAGTLADLPNAGPRWEVHGDPLLQLTRLELL